MVFSIYSNYLFKIDGEYQLHDNKLLTSSNPTGDIYDLVALLHRKCKV